MLTLHRFGVVLMIVLVSNGLIFGQSSVTALQRRIFDILVVLVIILSVTFAVVMNFIRRKQKNAPIDITPSNIAGLTDEEKDAVLSLIFASMLNSGELLEVELRYLYQILGVHRAASIVPRLFPELIDENGRIVPPSTGLSPRGEAALRRVLRLELNNVTKVAIAQRPPDPLAMTGSQHITYPQAAPTPTRDAEQLAKNSDIL
jgi:hypothetical protein